jgi:hypothetical protein
MNPYTNSLKRAQFSFDSEMVVERREISLLNFHNMILTFRVKGLGTWLPYAWPAKNRKTLFIKADRGGRDGQLLG